MSEFARAVLELPVSQERRQAERKAKRLFDRKVEQLWVRILRDKTLTPVQRLVGYELAVRVNFKTGYAWPSQDFIADLIPCNERSVRRAIDRLVDERTGWFRRQLDDKNYCYYPRFDRLKNEPDAGHDGGHFRQPTVDISGVQNVHLSLLGDLNNKNETSVNRGPAEQPTEELQPPDKPDGRKADRLKMESLPSAIKMKRLPSSPAKRAGPTSSGKILNPGNTGKATLPPKASRR